jgi:hypothetical protein
LYIFYILGGTADITVHEKASNGQLKELCRATGNDCGSTSIDARFFKVLQEIVGEKLLSELKENYPLSYLDLVREFEVVKRTVGTENKQKFSIRIPRFSIEKICQEFERKSLQSAIASSSHVNEITLINDKLRFNADLMIKLFTPTIDSIIILMKNTLSNRSTNSLSTILMVGGFSECPLIQDAVQAAFLGKRIIIPEDAGMSVLKGAVLFGHRPDFIRSRVMKYSYGVKTNIPFDKRRHDVKQKVLMDGEEKCDNIFSQIIEKDQMVEAGTKVLKSYFTPYPHQDVMDFLIYVSDKQYPSYVDDDGCSLLCRPTIKFPETCAERRWVDVEFIFGNTEIGMTAVDRNSGKKITSRFNLI